MEANIFPVLKEIGVFLGNHIEKILYRDMYISIYTCGYKNAGILSKFNENQSPAIVDTVRFQLGEPILYGEIDEEEKSRHFWYFLRQETASVSIFLWSVDCHQQSSGRGQARNAEEKSVKSRFVSEWKWDEAAENCDVEVLCTWYDFERKSGKITERLEETQMIKNGFFSCKFYICTCPRPIFLNSNNEKSLRLTQETVFQLIPFMT